MNSSGGSRSVPASPALQHLHGGAGGTQESTSPYQSRVVRHTTVRKIMMSFVSLFFFFFTSYYNNNNNICKSDELKRAIEEKYGSSGIAVPSSFGKSEEFKRAIEERYGSTGAGAAAANAAMLLTAFADIDDDEPSSDSNSGGDRRALMSRLRRSSSSSIASPQAATDSLRASATKGAVCSPVFSFVFIALIRFVYRKYLVFR